MSCRIETDAYGAVAIPTNAYWGPQTERSRILFAIGGERLPVGVVHCLGAQKAAAARANLVLGVLPAAVAAAIVDAATEVRDGFFDDQFPIGLWQTGSGTQTNMNANEVIANRANERLGQPLGVRAPIHPNDHVNLSQSSNDTFPTVMHVCTIRAVFGTLGPAVEQLRGVLSARADEFHDYVKVGMTHLQDALPITLGSEFRTWDRQLAAAWTGIVFHASALCELPQGGTASGSGVNGQPEFGRRVAEDLSEFAGMSLRASRMPSQFMAAHDGFVGLCGALNVLASAVLKICNDIRLQTSSLGGSAAMTLPDEGLSSSIMPAKRNATICEAVIQVCLRVMGNSATVLAANGAGALQLNTSKPLILNEVLNSITLLADAQCALATGCVAGLGAERDHLRRALDRSPVLGAILAPHIGYDAAARLIKEAVAEGLPIRDVVVRGGIMSDAEYDACLAPILDPDRHNGGPALEPAPTPRPSIAAEI